MGEWIEYAPSGGGTSFARSDALTNALWDRLSQNDWHYLNFVAGSSVWESRQDASIVSAHYEGERFVHLAVRGGAAEAVAGPLAAEFGLVTVTAPDAARPGSAPRRAGGVTGGLGGAGE